MFSIRIIAEYMTTIERNSRKHLYSISFTEKSFRIVISGVLDVEYVKIGEVFGKPFYAVNISECKFESIFNSCKIILKPEPKPPLICF